MLTHLQAHRIVGHKVPQVHPKDGGTVQLSGAWTLYELEALCVVIRQRMHTKGAIGAEEYLATIGETQTAKVPYAKIEAIIRRHYDTLVDNVSRTICEDLAQLSNPGSSPVYGKSATEEGGNKKISLTDSTFSNFSTEELKRQTLEMCAELFALGCSTATVLVASGMLASSVLTEDQEKAIGNIGKLF